MSYLSATSFVVKRPWLAKALLPLANWYANLQGYRQMGLLSDDLIPEENETVQLALKRLTAQQSYDRVYRIRRAMQLSLQHQLLPKAQWTKADDDVPYLAPLIREIEAEMKEKEQLDSMEVIKKH